MTLLEPRSHKPANLLFHIGHYKTGSTSIQDALATGRVRVEGKRILYPSCMNHNYLMRSVEVFSKSGKVLPGSPGFPGLGEIAQQLRLGDFDVAVLSGEVFEDANPDNVLRAMQHFMIPHVEDYAVIAYVRPHGARLLSGFAEQVKVGMFGESLDMFFEKTRKTGRFFYTRRLPDWAATFGAHFRLRPFLRSELAGGSVVRDFLETGLGADSRVHITDSPSSNESLCLEDLLVVKMVQESLADRDRNLRLNMAWELAPAFSALARPEGSGTRLKMHRSLAERIRETYAEDAEAIDRQFFGGRLLLRDDLDRTVDEALPQAQSLDPADHFSAEMLRAVSVLSAEINGLLDHESGSWNDFLRNRRIAALHADTSTPSASLPLRRAPAAPRKKNPVPGPKLGKLALPAQIETFLHALDTSPGSKAKTPPKTIWTFWDTGVESAPDVVRRSLETWRHFNPDHEVRAVDLEAANTLLDLDLATLFEACTVDMGWAGKSDLIRLLLLAKYGGVWADATTFCLKPLSDWLPGETRETGFFSFREVSPKRDRELISWFMAATPKHPLVLMTLLKGLEFLFKPRATKMPVTGFSDYREIYGLKDGALPGCAFLEDYEAKHGAFPYFWMFYIFRDMIREVPGLHQKWLAQGNRFAQGKHPMVRFARSFVSKQSYKGRYHESPFYHERLAALFDGDRVRDGYSVSNINSPKAPYTWHEIRPSLQISEVHKTVFIHIPKCGGTSIDSSNLFEGPVRRFGHLALTRYRRILGRRIANFRILTTVRNPWDRLGSAFFYASLESPKFKNADTPQAVALNAEFGADFSRFLPSFTKEPDRFLPMLWFRPSVEFFDPRSCELPHFVQKLEEIDDLGPMREFLNFPSFEVPHQRKGPMRERKQSLYTPELFKAVGEIYRDDIDAFGYQDTRIDDLSY